jgi:glycine/D-amino acid oxidase-like deaminating enzyme/nitrite reductase/ring-hydroxylating ferredoxin subunit
MNNQSRSLWMSTLLPAVPSLEGREHQAQVCVIGGGIAGVSVAMALAERGNDVLLIDKDGLGAGETGRTSAHLADALDDRFYRLERWHGEDGARLAAASHAAAIDQIERWCNDYRIDCDFRRVPGYLVLDERSRSNVLQRELAAARRAGLGVESLPDAVGALPGPALRFERQARFHPLKYLAGLAGAARNAGVRFARAEAIELIDGDPMTVIVDAGARIRARDIVVAANVPFHRRVVLHTKQAAYRTFVVAGRIPRGDVPDALIWDTGDPYHYARIQPADDGYDWLIVGGADHKTGQEPEGNDAFGDLIDWARQLCASFAETDFAWSGQVLEPVDGLAFIGADPGAEHVYVVTGDSGNGLTHGTIAALLLPDLMRGTDHPWRALYDPARKRLNGAWLEENANVAAQYRDWLLSGDVASAETLAPGEGAIVRHGVHRFALFRDDDSRLRMFSARCPHLGCSVRWNTVERSWDCPCHGSRFAADDGRVLNGPADRGLDILSPEDAEHAVGVSTAAR